MDFTFGIITTGENDDFLKDAIMSIEINNIPNYEIIIVGNTKIESTEKIKIFQFNENIKPLWITRKKNIIIENAIYENIVIMHDYIKLDDGWYQGFLLYGTDFKYCINKIKNRDGTRYRDYLLSPYYFQNISDYFQHHIYLPYNFINNNDTNNFLYISGAYFVIKREVALETKLNENLTWGQGEDIDYSQKLNEKGVIIECNSYSTVHLLKQKEKIYFENNIDNIYELDIFLNIYSKKPLWKYNSKIDKWTIV